MMAAKRKAESTSVKLVRKGFNYKSKFSRDLESGSHKMYVESLTITPESDSLQEQLPKPQPFEDLLPASYDDTADITLNMQHYKLRLRLMNHLMMGWMTRTHCIA